MATNTLPVSQGVGSQLYGPVAVPDGLRSVSLAFANWPSNNTLALQAEYSLDGGGTWIDLGGFPPTPGNRGNGGGRFTTDCSAVFSPLPLGTGRLVRATLTVAGGSISTLLTVTTS